MKERRSKISFLEKWIRRNGQSSRGAGSVDQGNGAPPPSPESSAPNGRPDDEFIGSISEMSGALANTSVSLAGNIEFCTDLVAGISESIRQIASGSESIAESARGNQLMLAEVSKGMEQIAESSLALANETAEVAQKAGEGLQSIERAVAQMQIISEAASDSSTAVAQMDLRTEEIDRVTLIMAEIASQIQLLSLNAAIEAARAGEYGRGFAVVADEIRKLADQSTTSAKDIANTVAHIRQSSRESKEAMNRVSAEIQAGYECVDEAGRSFQEIVTLTEQVSFKVQEVSSVTEEVSASAEQILVSVQETVSITEVSQAGTREIAVCTDEQMTMMEESLASARQLREQATQLNGKIRSYAGDEEVG
ncbi:methyl-accepting chemotaxis protein [Cohnella zeiphila]|uniref:Methyl-accepting transducer domain-containing protein n=1 Tax=Cohnella zeiphila TaxID=2761120 RepID=A0A7X0SV86_9BACL|nr:methyl-accepting chemotaxis protein [Cohnella zeiphila]MBB6734493.1 hypothetical protein [Cohnella zeiphila]